MIIDVMENIHGDEAVIYESYHGTICYRISGSVFMQECDSEQDAVEQLYNKGFRFRR